MKVDQAAFIDDPSSEAKELVRIVDTITRAYNKRFSSKNIITVFLREVALQVYIKETYKDWYGFLNDLDVSKISSKKELLELFTKLQEGIIWNNIALSYLHSKKQTIESTVRNREDERMILLQEIARKRRAPDDFRRQFGHYTLEGFDPSARPFSQYADDEILELAAMINDLPVRRNKPTIDHVLGDQAYRVGVLIALRELGTDCTFRVIDWLRGSRS